MIQGDTQLTPNQGPTYASLSIQDGGMQIRRAAATAREALLQRAADILKVAKDTLTVQDGLVISRAGGNKLSYPQLIGAQQLAMKIDPTASLNEFGPTARGGSLLIRIFDPAPKVPSPFHDQRAITER